jgi:hypothetical protein
MNLYPIPEWFINKYNRRYPITYSSVEDYIKSNIDSEEIDELMVRKICEKSILHEKLFIPVYVLKNSEIYVTKSFMGENYNVQNRGISTWDTYYYNALEKNPLVYLEKHWRISGKHTIFPSYKSINQEFK